MGKFNLLDEPWISVLISETGEKKNVSLIELFQEAGRFKSLAGEMETQNFAVMRLLISILQTVFSRFDYHGNPLPGIDVDDRWVQTEIVDTDDLKAYRRSAAKCWKQLYKDGNFPEVVTDYLERWRDLFFLFDEKHPFYQVNEAEMDEIMSRIPKKNQPTSIYGKNLNRTISESENKAALFSPIANSAAGKRGNKDVLSADEFARWLVMFQGYSGLADKVAFVSEGQRSSKGWLFDLGGIFLRGHNLYETLVLNYLPESIKDQEFDGRIQRPCWEADGIEVVNRLLSGKIIDNLAELYTNWSRAIYADPNSDTSKPMEIRIVKLPEIDHTENSFEPMTLWKWNDSGPNKGKFTPRKHTAGQSLWRSFGIITMKSSSSKDIKQKQPGIFSQYERLAKIAGSRWTDLVGVSMKDDGNATSWLPVDEIADGFQINDLIITDADPDGWVIRINDAVETTKSVVSGTFRNFLRGICEIRNLDLKGSLATGFIDRGTAEMYAEIDNAFKEWLSSIEPDDSKEEILQSWNSQLRRMVLDKGEELFDNSSVRDLTGIDKDDRISNIATKYWQFVNNVNKKLGKGGQA